MIPAIRGQLHACRRKASPHYNLIGGFAVMGAGVGVGGGTYAATGRNAKIIRQVAPLAMARGLFAMTGGNAAIDAPGAKNLAPSTGVFALTGNNAVLGAKLPSASGTFALTGNSAKMTAGPGAGRFALTGNNAIMGAGAALGSAAFSMSGIAARLNAGDSLAGGSGTYSLTGRASILNVGLGIGGGAFALTGNAANEHYGYNLPSATGAFTLTGRAATMVTGAHGIGGGTGTFTLNGRAAGLGAGLNAGAASFALTGRAAALGYGRNTHVSAGTYSLTGNVAAIGRRLLLNSGTFALTGNAAAVGAALGAGSGTFAMTGIATAMNVELHPVTGSFALTGNAATMVGETVTLNPADKSADITLSNGDLTFAGTTSPGHHYNVRGTQSGSAGRYFEVTHSGIGNDGAGHTTGIGIANLSQSQNTYPGDPNGIGWFASGYAEWPGQSNNFATFAAGDVLGVYLKTTTVEFSKNGALVGTATSLPSGALYPIISPVANGDAGTVNFGASPLSYLPLGATSWDGSQTNSATQANSGSFVLTGRAAALGEGLPAGSGTFTLTGRASVMGESLGATGIGTYSVTGNAAALTRVGFNQMNPLDAGGTGELTFSNNNLTVTHESSTNAFAAARALTGWTTGKHYAEVHIDNYAGGGNMAFALLDKSASTTPVEGSQFGSDSHGATWWSNGWAGYNNAWIPTDSGSSQILMSTGQTLMVAYDADSKHVFFGSNGVWLGQFGSSDPVGDSGYIDMSSPGPAGAVYAVLSLGQSDAATFNFGRTAFAYVPPTGFLGEKGGNIVANSGTFTLTGRAAGEAINEPAGAGSFTMTGRAAILSTNSMNPASASPSGELTFSNNNLTVTHTGADDTFTTVRAVSGWTTGKHYLEIHLDNRVSGNFAIILTDPTTVSGGGDSHGMAWYPNGFAGYNNSFIPTNDGSTLIQPSTGQTMMLAYDANAKHVFLGCNGDWLGQFGSSNPAADSGYIDMSSPGVSGAVSLAFFLGQSDAVTVNFGASAFAYTPPTGFS
jgi:hypothetical protein